MKQDRIISWVLGIINIVLVVGCLFLFFKSDRIAPELSVAESDLVVKNGTAEAEMLENVTAYDNHDGNLTSKVVIEKTVKNEEDNTLIVFYAVSDQAGNVAKASYEFQAVFVKEDKDELMKEIKEAGAEAEFDVDLKKETATEQEETEESAASPSEEPSASPSVTPTEEVQVTEETQQPEAETEPIEEISAEVPVEQAAPVEEAVVAPVFSLNTSQVVTPLGVSPNWGALITTMSDDVDSYEQLLANITVSEYDINTEGTYQVTVSTIDSDGNSSQAVPLTIIVQAPAE